MPGQLNITTFTKQFHEKLPFTANSDQTDAIEKLGTFIDNQNNTDLFILKGYAGTGKTNLVSALSQILPAFKWKSVLLAPTGRAAKVLSLYSKRPAQTIHKKIFKKSVNEGGSVYFSLGENPHKNTVFIIDEASMIGLDSNVQSSYASPGLLESLFEYVFAGENCKLLFVGDTAQLPPVGCDESPALNEKLLKASFHLTIFSCELKQVARQSLESGILENATKLRELLANYEGQMPKLFLTKDVIKVEGDELQDVLNTAYGQYGFNDVLIVTRSNKRANLFNQAVRARVRYMEEDICAGDLLMNVKNNYFWLDEKSDVGFIANGDSFEIKRILGRNELYGFNFLNCVVGFIDYPQMPDLQVRILLESINSDTSSITQEQQKMLYNSVLADVADEPIKGRRMTYIKQSEYYNALQAKFCYAVTCHKAQGGQWPVVFIDQGYLTKEMIDFNYLRWLYTAVTRAKEKVYLINFSEDFFS
ncbi:MAG TPA: ATP-binding domain-containing protein [Bacteroidia bacterium]|jgi:exodeoxyribonuclease-5|nr:ATP-binding domain-containing protein [Bacteroidia bacterium]